MKRIKNNSLFKSTQNSNNSLYTDSNYKNAQLITKYAMLSRYSNLINNILKEFSLGHFELISTLLSRNLHNKLALDLLLLAQNPNDYPEYEIIRYTAVYALEGLYQSIYQYATLKDTQKKLESARERASILDDLKKLQEYINTLKGANNLFPDVTVSVMKAEIKPEYAVYIKQYGYPASGIFDASKLASILLTMVNKNEIEFDPIVIEV